MENDLENIRWGIVGVGEVRRRDEGFKTLKSRDLFYYHGEQPKSVGNVEFFINKHLTGNLRIVQSASPELYMPSRETQLEVHRIRKLTSLGVFKEHLGEKMQFIKLSLETADKLDTSAIYHQNAMIKAYEARGPEKCKAVNRDVPW